ncbi:MAG: S-layer homology domain-containing protein [Negativicutes bacterium]|nr:S-layer homology domain-containing protein [Negativicutes bacterium]
MKKNFVVALVALFVLGIATTAFAAANPFVDVPAKHWAYDAVAKLAKAGIVDGYGDGTFRGDKTMTRYEMAQIVAKAMAKSDKADAQLKATIDKLAVEFAAELNNLGVRVAKLEKNASNIKIEGESRLRYTWDDADQKTGTNAFDWRQRLHLNAPVTDKISYTARMEAVGVFDGQNTATVAFNRNFFTVKDILGVDSVKIGRQGLYANKYLAVGKTSNNDGVFVDHKLGSKTAVQAFWMDENVKTEFKGINFVFNPTKTFDVEASYYAADLNNANFVDLGFAYNLGNGFNFVGEYVQSDVANDPKAWAAQLSYNWKSKFPVKKFFSTINVVDIKKAHDQGVVLSYRSVESGALPGTEADGSYQKAYTQFGSINGAKALVDNVNVWYVGYQNVMAKNVLLNVEYAKYSEKAAPAYDNKYATAYVQFFF